MEDKQEKIKYPNRVATQLRQSHQLSNLLDGEGMNIIDVEKQNERVMEQQLADMQIRRMASETGVLTSLTVFFIRVEWASFFMCVF